MEESSSSMFLYCPYPSILAVNDALATDKIKTTHLKKTKNKKINDQIILRISKIYESIADYNKSFSCKHLWSCKFISRSNEQVPIII